MRILLTGASGFIGKNYLENTLFDEVSTISRSKLEAKKIYKHLNGDLTDKDFLDKISNEKYDVIIHAAWKGLPKRTKELNNLNFDMYRNILRAFGNNLETKHIFIGSCLEYGNLKGMISENTKGSDIDCFGQTKLELLKYIEASGIKYNWLRLFYNYGKYQHKNALINSIRKDIHNNRKININNPNTTHDYIYVKDTVALIDKIASNNLITGVFNAGKGELVPNGEIANTISKITGNRPIFKIKSESGLTADIRKAKKFLNWSPKYSLLEGLMEILEGEKND